MEIKNKFYDNISIYKPVLFHWLDGFLKTDIGNTLPNTHNFICSIPQNIIGEKKIIISTPNECYVDNNHGEQLYLNGIELTYLQKTGAVNKKLFLTINTDYFSLHTFNRTNNNKSIYHNANSSDYFNSDFINKLLEIFRYNIINTGDELHAISLLTFVKDKSLHICVINSGEGLDPTMQLDKQQKLYSPHLVFIVCDDINDRNKLVIGIKKILAMAFFYFVYDDLKSMSSNIKPTTKKTFAALQTNSIYLIKKGTLDLLKFIVANSEGADDISFGDFTLKQLLAIKRNSNGDLEFDRIYVFPTTFYFMCCKLLNNNTVLTVSLDLANKINSIDMDKLKPVSTISTSVINKMVFHAIDSQLCIYAQESGSCSWYSMYWPLLMYHIYYEPDFDKYFTFISEINNLFYKYVQDIFSEKQLISEFNSESFTPWKIVYNFFCDIGLLNKEVFETYTDSIFKVNFPCDIVTKDWEKNNNEINDLTKYKDLCNVTNNIINESMEHLKSKDKSEVMIMAINNLSKDAKKNTGKDKHKFTNTLIYIFYSIYMGLSDSHTTSDRTPSEKLYLSFSSDAVHKKIKFIKDTLTQLVKRGDTKLGNELNEINKLINALYGLVNSLNDVINKNLHLYEYYHIATFFINNSDVTDTRRSFQEKQLDIISLAKFLSASVIVSNIYCVLFKYLEEINNYTIGVTNIIGLCNDIITLSIYGPQSKNNCIYIPLNIREFREDFINKYARHIGYTYIISPYLKKNSVYPTESEREVGTLKNKSYSDFIKERDYYYDNPEYIYNNYSDIEEIFDDLFIRIHISDIIKKHEVRKKLIVYFANKFVSYYVSNAQSYLIFVLNNLHLLIFGYELDIDIDIDLDNFNGVYNNIFKYFVSSKKYDEFYNQIYDILKQKGKMDFPLYLADNFTDLKKSEIVKFGDKIKKIYSTITIVESYKKDKLTIDGNEYNLLDTQRDFMLLKFFSVNNTYPTTVYKVLNKDQKLYSLITHNENYVFKIIGNIHESNFIVNKIFVNGNEVIKKQDINFPFKYVIPTTCNHLIYKNGSACNILYFINQYAIIDKNDRIIHENKMNPQIIEISINENTMLYPKTSDFKIFGQLCKNYHIRPLNIIFSGDDYGFSYKITDKIDKQYNYNKKTFLTDNFLPVVSNNINLLNKITYPHSPPGGVTLEKNQSDPSIDKLKTILNQSEYTDAFDKLIGKIESCRIVETNKSDTIEYFKCLRSQTLAEITKYTELYKVAQFNYIVSKHHFDYLLLLKVLNTVNMLILLIDDQDLFCSQLKILRELYKTRKYHPIYNFEAIFETLIGYELLDEQQTRFNDIVSNYTEIKNIPTLKSYSDKTTNIVNYNQTGGHIYPLHHFMMGKGKSAVMTPMLMLYFALIVEKQPYIIVPEHLVNDTKSDINNYGLVFGVTDKVTVLSASEVKNQFLEGEFILNEDNKNKVFIIDEFDSLLDPIKSNYNIVDKKEINTTNLYRFIHQVVYLIKLKNLKNINISDIDLLKPFAKFNLTEPIIINILQEINQIYQSIQSDSFVENINWGIDSKKYLVVPYINKDKPIENSNFTSCIITIFLTLYYFVILKNLDVSELVVQFITEKNLFIKIFNMKQPLTNIKQEIIDITSKNQYIKNKLFQIFFDEIFSTLTLAEEQKNTSFVDILNIDSIYKIGYSGTINLDLPAFVRADNIFKMERLVDDKDESVNVLYALVKGKTITIKQLEPNEQNILQKYIDQLKSSSFSDYDAFIDQVGIFKNILNKEVAEFFYKYFAKSRDIIYMTESDSKFVLSNDTQLEYSSSKKYSNPFIYYSQSHVIGVDIKQDYLPKMKGLVTINNKSVYTNVAQAVFRLRKLNLGHSIDILFVTNETDSSLTNVDICSLIKSNDEKLKNDKKDLLIYQTLKSEIRKKDMQDMIEWYKKNKNTSVSDESLKKSHKVHFNKIYTEKIKYYFIESIPTELESYLNGIVYTSNLKIFDKLFEPIKDITKLKKLVFNMDTNSISVAIAGETEKEIVNVKAVGNTIYKYNNLIKPNIKFDYTRYMFDHISESDIFNRITVPINKYISCVPNICTHYNGYKFIENNSGLVFVFIPNIHKLLLIPGYMAPIFSSDYILLNTINLTLLNNKSNEFFTHTGFFDCLRYNDFIKFINDGTHFELLNTKTYTDIKTAKELFVLYIILANFQNKLAGHEKFINKINKKDIINELTMTFDNYIKSWTNKKYVNEIIVPITKDIHIIDPFIKSNEEYKCDDIIYKYKTEENKINDIEFDICEQNQLTYFRNIQSDNDKVKSTENKKQITACEANKANYIGLSKCEENKEIYSQQDQIQACTKYKIEYSDSIKIKIQTEIAQEETILEENNNGLIKYTNKLNELYKSASVTEKEKNITKLENEIENLGLLKKPTRNIASKSKKERDEISNYNAELQTTIIDKTRDIKVIKDQIDVIMHDIENKNSKKIEEYKEKILKYERKISNNKRKIKSLQILLEN